MLKNKKDVFIIGFFFLASALLAYSIINSMTSTPEEEAEVLSGPAEDWLDAVANEDPSRAIALAEDISADTDSYSMPETYVGLCEDNGIAPQFLGADFNRWDFQSWRHAYVFNNLANKIVDSAGDDTSTVEALFNAVNERIEPTEPEEGKYVLWPHKIWTLEKGVCDRQAWVLSELAYQLGYDTQIVYLRNPETLVSPHTIAEIRKDDKVWVADPYVNELLEDVSIADLAKDPHVAESLWPEREDYQEGITRPAFWLPSFPQDYCLRNQELQNAIQSALGDRAPRFGEPPIDRLRRYLSLLDERERDYPYNFWFYPFRLLRAQIMRTSKEN